MSQKYSVRKFVYDDCFKPTKPSSANQVWLSKRHLPFHYPQLFPCPLLSVSYEVSATELNFLQNFKDFRDSSKILLRFPACDGKAHKTCNGNFRKLT